MRELSRLALYEYDLNDQQIARATGLSDGGIRKWRYRNNLPPNRPPNGSRSIKQRLYDMVEKSPDGCWEWQGNKNGTGTGYGYGRMWFGETSRMAHKVSYKIHKGDIPDDMIVRHTCDNPSCVNPDHLLLGTMKDNMRDAIERGRTARGEDQHLSKLTREDVLLLRRLYFQTPLTTYDLADEFGVSRPAISTALRGETWKHVGGPIRDSS